MDLSNSAAKYFGILFFLAAAVVGIRAQNLATARILSAEGSVEISRSSPGGVPTRVKFSPNDMLAPGDVIKTGAGGRLVLGLADGSQAIVGENSTVEIKDAQNSPRTLFNILKGKTRIKIQKLGGKPNPYRVTTPTTVIAVRGTIFDVFVRDDKTEVFVQEGEVSVSSLIAPEREVILAPGQFTRVEKGLSPRQPAPFKPERNEQFFTPNRDRRGDRDDNGDGRDGPGRNSPPRRPNDSDGDPRRRSGDSPNSPNRDNPPPRRPLEELFFED